MELSIEDSSTASINETAREWIDKVNNSEMPAMEAYVNLWAMQKAIERIQAQIKLKAMDEVEDMGREAAYDGIGVQVRYGRPLFDFSEHEEWSDLDKQIKELELRKREIEKVEKHEYLNPNIKTGEINSNAVYRKHSKSYLRLERN